MIPTILGGALVIQLALWTPVLRGAQNLREVYPEAVIVAARVPKPADEILGTTWPHLYRPLPSKVSVMIDEYGISLWSPTATESALVLFFWNDVERVIAAEHVELRLAVPGIALLPSFSKVAFPLALYRRGPAIAYLIHGAELIDMAATIESMRPPR